jgi:hypothetical protein
MKARITPCRKPAGGCGEPIVFLRTKNGKLCPIEITGEEIPDEDDLFDGAIHRAHHRTCRAYMEIRAAKGGKGTEQEEGF